VRSFPLEQSPFALRLGKAAVFYVGYLAKMLWPADLTFFYMPPAAGLRPWQIAVSALILAVLTAAAVRARRPPVLVGWLWYLGTLVSRDRPRAGATRTCSPTATPTCP
jgi:hypothetical protein